MKKSAFTFLAVLATVFSLVSCTKDEAVAVHNAYFWTTQPYNEQALTLFVDGQAMGHLPYFSTALTCSDDSLKKQAVFMQLKSGRYLLEAKDQLGVVKSSTTMKVTDSGIGSYGGIGGIGGMGASSGGGCLLVYLHE